VKLQIVPVGQKSDGSRLFNWRKGIQAITTQTPTQPKDQRKLCRSQIFLHRNYYQLSDGDGDGKLPNFRKYPYNSKITRGLTVSSIKTSKIRSYDTLGAAVFSSGEAPLGSTKNSWSTVGESTFRSANFLPKKIIIIESRGLVRDSLVRTIQATNEMNVVGVTSVEEALEEFGKDEVALILLCVPGPLKIVHQGNDISRLITETGVPVTVLGDGENFGEILQMFDLGAVGYISTDLSAEVVVESLRLMLAGGKFIPASILLTARPTSGFPTLPLDHYKCMFTERQLAVLEGLSLGKANKVIANELNMKEGTVKVYVRNLMRLLNARNRTELALIVADQMRPRAGHSPICS
jgi:DNA-binding NarL/FixJ family response regulator